MTKQMTINQTEYNSLLMRACEINKISIPKVHQIMNFTENILVKEEPITNFLPRVEPIFSSVLQDPLRCKVLINTLYQLSNLGARGFFPDFSIKKK